MTQIEPIVTTVVVEEIMSATATIRLPEDVIQRARVAGKVEYRTPAQQIEYWVSLAQCAIDNPD